jgi:glycosyltransferase involved in cell wall biosynthesis
LKDRKNVTFIKTNLIDIDPRLEKESRALIQAGYAVTLICWDREGKIARGRQVRRDGDLKEIPFRLRAPFGPRILAFLPLWWLFVFFKLSTLESAAFHATNLDSILPALLVGKLKRKPVIYELLDIYEDEIQLPGFIRNAALAIDKRLMRCSRAVIVADEEQITALGGISNRVVEAIYDSPPDEFESPPQAGNYSDKDFVLFYAGVLFSDRKLNLDKMFEAVKSLSGIKLVIAGYGDLVETIQEWSSSEPEKVEFIGRIKYADVIATGSSCQSFFVLRDTVVPSNKYICGSTLFNSMLCGKPLIVNQGSSTARKVQLERCGLVVDANNVDDVRKAIIQLKQNPELCRELGANARRAYEERYRWGIMKTKLIQLYQAIVR